MFDTTKNQKTCCEIAVVGGGIIGLSCAWKLAQRGAKVLLLERGELAREASWAAAGMLAPRCEALHSSGAGNDALHRFCLHSRDLYADFAAELREFTGIDAELSLAKSTFSDWRKPGILLIGEASQAAEWARDPQYFDLSSLPYLSAEIAELPALWLTDEGQVDNRKFTNALVQACRKSGVQIWENAPVYSVHCEGDSVTTLETAAGIIRPQKVLLAAGAWSGQIGGLPQNVPIPVRPVKGQMFVLRSPIPLDRLIYARPGTYIVPRRDGRIVIGSSMEEGGYEKHLANDFVARKRAEVEAIIPALRDGELLDHWCGFRPAAADGLPVLGQSRVKNLYMATGHFRNGILMTPATAEAISGHIMDGNVIDAAFSPQRFKEK